MPKLAHISAIAPAPTPELTAQPTLADLLPLRPPFGLYAESPQPATLVQLAHGSPSPDQRHHMAHTAQGLWITRTDGAWLWHVQLPARAEPKAPPLPPGTHPPPAPAKAKPANPPALPLIVGTARWTERSTLLLRDDQGAWYEADPLTALVVPLPAALRGAEELTLSPDGRKLFYYTPGRRGRQLWTANADGSEPRSHGENLVGRWNPDSSLKTQPQAPQQPVGNPNHPANIPM